MCERGNEVHTVAEVDVEVLLFRRCLKCIRSVAL